jgi:hypothetical protein
MWQNINPVILRPISCIYHIHTRKRRLEAVTLVVYVVCMYPHTYPDRAVVFKFQYTGTLPSPSPRTVFAPPSLARRRPQLSPPFFFPAPRGFQHSLLCGLHCSPSPRNRCLFSCTSSSRKRCSSSSSSSSSYLALRVSVTSCCCSGDLDESAAIIMLGRVFGRPKAEPSALSSLDKLNEVSSPPPPLSLSLSLCVSLCASFSIISSQGFILWENPRRLLSIGTRIAGMISVYVFVRS